MSSPRSCRRSAISLAVTLQPSVASVSTTAVRGALIRYPSPSSLSRACPIQSSMPSARIDRRRRPARGMRAAAVRSVSDRHPLLGADPLRALAGALCLCELTVDVIPVDLPEERLDVLLAPVGRGAEVARVGVLVHVDGEDRDHVVDGPEVLAVEDVVEQRAVVEVVADQHPATGRAGGLLDRVEPLVDPVELLLDQLGEAPLGL